MLQINPKLAVYSKTLLSATGFALLCMFAPPVVASAGARVAEAHVQAPAPLFEVTFKVVSEQTG